MKISYNWLKQFIKIDWTAEKTSELLTDLGLEVEGLDEYQSSNYRLIPKENIFILTNER